MHAKVKMWAVWPAMSGTERLGRRQKLDHGRFFVLS